MSRDFATESAKLHEGLESDRFTAAHALRELEESWARHVLGLHSRGSLSQQVAKLVKAGWARAQRGRLRYRHSLGELRALLDGPVRK